jgi:SagB-type dehydrogenase family enzyme
MDPDGRADAGVEVIGRYHAATAHSPRPRRREHVLAGFRPMVPGNRPAPFKRYRDVDREPLPVELRPVAGEPGSLDVLAGHATAGGAVDLDVLARLLYFSAGVTRFAGGDPARVWFRASASAGNLHPLEVYVACGPGSGVGPGLYHFDPESYALGRLRPVDVRPHLARAAADPALAAADAVVVVTGIPWRTCWKYAERGWRHIWWDAGSMLANLLAVAEAHGVAARVVLGFVDRDVSGVLGIDGTSELPVAAVAIGAESLTTEPPTDVRELDSLDPLDPLDPPVEPISPAPVAFPLVTAAQRATELDDPEAVTGWRHAATAGDVSWTGAATPGPVEVPTSILSAAAPESVESVILRRGSTRVMRPADLPGEVVELALRMATRPVPLDAVPPGRTLLDHRLAVHGVDGYAPGLYRWADATLTPLDRRTGEDEATTRRLSTFLCLGQPLGGDSAYTVYEAANLDGVLAALGPRGYRAAHVEAGIVNGRLLLAAHALGHGATGLTFFDDAVREAFGIPVGCLLVTAVGTPAYRPTPGGWPGEPTRLDRYDTLMTRLELRLRRR